MYILYLDDAGSPKNAKERHFVLAGTILHETKLKWVSERLDSLAESIAPDDPDSVEFHASAIFGGRETPWRAMDKAQRISIIKSVLGVIPQEGREREVRVLGCVVDKTAYPNVDPVELAFEDLCSRFDMFIKRRYNETKQITLGMIIVDESAYETTLQKLARNFRRIGTQWNVTRGLPEVPLFVDSRSSRGIQLADHVAYALYRRYESGDINYFNVIQNHFDEDNGRIHGLAHKTHLYEGRSCPSCLTKRLSGQR